MRTNVNSWYHTLALFMLWMSVVNFFFILSPLILVAGFSSCVLIWALPDTFPQTAASIVVRTSKPKKIRPSMAKVINFGLGITLFWVHAYVLLEMDAPKAAIKADVVITIIAVAITFCANNFVQITGRKTRT